MATAMRSVGCVRGAALRRPRVAPRVAPAQPLPVAPVALHGMSGRKCMLTGKKANNAMSGSFSHARNHRLQHVNLQYKWIYWPEQQRYIRLRVSTKALKTIEKKGLEAMAAKVGLDLMSLRYRDARPERKDYVAENPGSSQTKKKKEKLPSNVGRAAYIPRWKAAKLAKMAPKDAQKEKEAFVAKYGRGRPVEAAA